MTAVSSYWSATVSGSAPLFPADYYDAVADEHWGKVEGGGEDVQYLSNLFPSISYWYSISFRIRAAGTLTVGFKSWDATYEHPEYVPAYLADAPSMQTDTVLDTGDGYATMHYLIAAPEGVEHQLQIDVAAAGDVYITDVLVDPHEGQYEFFDGSTPNGLPQDYRWHGGLTDSQFSLWYNNYLNTEARLFGHWETDHYVGGILEEWVPTGASVVPHWESFTVSHPTNWVRDYFYPLIPGDVIQRLVPTFYDAFERANESPVAAPWVTPGYCAGPQDLLGGALVSPGAGNRGSVVDTAPYGLSTDVKITADFTVNGGASPDCGIMVSSSDSSDFLLFFNNHTSWGVYRCESAGFGTTATLGSGGGAPGGAINKLFEVTAVGDTYSYWINGTLLWSGTYAPLVRTSTFHGWYNGRDENVNTLNSFQVEAYP